MNHKEPLVKLEILTFYATFKKAIETAKAAAHNQLSPEVVAHVLADFGGKPIFVYRKDAYYKVKTLPPHLTMTYAPFSLPK